jgi:putative transposase
LANCCRIAGNLKLSPDSKINLSSPGAYWVCRALTTRAHARSVQLFLIESGKPNQNAYIESFNGRFRDECLTEHWFTNMRHAQVIIEAWRREYNEERTKKSLGGMPPTAYARSLAQKSAKLTPESKVLLILKTGGHRQRRSLSRPHYRYS